MWLQVPLSSSQCALLLSCASISRINLLFSRVLFSFLELPFCFSAVPFYFSKMLCCFPELLFSFPELPFFLLCSSFSKNVFPHSWLHLLALFRAAQKDNTCLAFVLSSLGIHYWPIYDAFLITLKPLHEVYDFLWILFKFRHPW